MKRKSIIINSLLLCWFSLDMIGVYFRNSYLVSRSWREDGIYFIIFTISLLLYIYKEKMGQVILTTWLSIWLVAQFMSHWRYTLLGGGEGLMKFYEGSIKLINTSSWYIPDVYHLVLHLLIVASLISVIASKLKESSHS